ncbi:MAG: energy-coupling factor ABC transporter ATP-binding protein, partial [Oscillospiraceae bacterium]|nr:energy-coupling factor ABC transporter ATP-binding protein [Oscillospiraceae bacterium]
MIELDGVSYAYEGDITALENVTLTIREGESVALLGSNGCGKSTLLKIICGVLTPQSGTYSFNGDVITAKTLSKPVFSKTFHQRVGFVFQNSDAQLFCATVADEVAFGPRQMGLPEEEISRRVADCLEMLGLTGFENRAPYHLSGGEKRKTAIAAALAMNPDVLVLDEPMNGLDPRAERWLAGFLKQLASSGKTVVTSTHDLELVREISTRAALFDENHAIAADGKTDDVLSDIDLLRRVNLVDRFYHKHGDGGHVHF